jgi:hypothetical protein
MKKLLIACAIVALSASGAFAQSQPAPGASSEGNVGPGAGMPRTKTHVKSGTTTGMSTRSHRMANPSSEGNVGPGTNNNSGPQSGGR